MFENRGIRREVDLPQEILLALFLNLDIQKHERMQPKLEVLFDPPEPAIGFPVVRPERYGYRLTEIVELKAAGANSVHDGSIVDNLGFNSK